MIIRIATRRSKLALVQSHWIKSRLQALHPGLEVELREYVTRGDQIQNVPLSQVGGKGLFTKEIEDALLSGEADLAVHSLKDLPSELPDGLTLGAVPEREDPRDALVLPAGAAEGHAELAGLPKGARVGSSSVRRMAQLLAARPDLRVESVRGNVDTRLRKLDEGQYDALILAAAGLRRLGLRDRISAALAPEVSTPAPGQGALGLELRAIDEQTRRLVDALNHPASRARIVAERVLMDAVGGGCSVPLGAYAEVRGEVLNLIAVLASPDGACVIRQSGLGPVTDPARIGREVAERLLAQGGLDLLEGN